MSSRPDIAAFTTAPLRNRIRVELNAPVPEVWALVGDPARMPEYSAGLARVEACADAGGRYESYVCHFKPMPGEEGIVSRDIMRWWEPDHGWASSGAEADAFGLSNDLNVTMIEARNEGATLTWEVYFDAQDVAGMKAHFDEALADIAQNLVRRFGGRLVERIVEV